MNSWNDIFGPGSNFERRYIPDYAQLAEQVSALRKLGKKIVLASGAWDLFHIGHATYLEKAKDLGDILIVGVDSDEKVRTRKGENRPIVPESERMMILAHLRHVDLITLKNIDDKKWQLIKTIRPDILVISKTTKSHTQEEIEAMKEYCGEVVIMEPQATTSTSAKIRLLLLDITEKIEIKLQEVLEFVRQLKGGLS
ncbi:MAG: adenylyltransferase/cytidyltransferase family protein [Minisyncoccia bacterium]|jgi:D-beta-D-heptose 7-phosphate kinase/D-beta-D-heptose 1-phosphate adenosyltransferase